MNIQTKSSIILLATLIIGILLGVFIDRSFMYRSFVERRNQWRPAEFFLHAFQQIIKPDEAQYDKIRKITEKYAEKLARQHIESLNKSVSIMDSLKMELDPVLTAEQKKRLKQHFEQIRKRHFGPRRGQPMRPFDREPPPFPPAPGKPDSLF